VAQRSRNGFSLSLEPWIRMALTKQVHRLVEDGLLDDLEGLHCEKCSQGAVEAWRGVDVARALDVGEKCARRYMDFARDIMRE
ncbi:unnamed protein product, partial [Prorocentrum cordatum]